MAQPEQMGRISFDPSIMGGRPCIKGTRVTVATVLGLVADGLTVEAILADYPYLVAEDIRAALAYAAWLAREEVGGDRCPPFCSGLPQLHPH
ncbi:MAG: DUF433 domain-containing protein [Geminicoccaceae bacterium]|nr:DUF433 domain-containing protein [Geminicoccaceae bacterium]HRY22820.1 DUF433 domain-containing protein [Geminicoccaceae bacterium]